MGHRGHMSYKMRVRFIDPNSGKRRQGFYRSAAAAAPVRPVVPVKTFAFHRRHVPASTLTSVFISLLAGYFESRRAAIKRKSH